MKGALYFFELFREAAKKSYFLMAGLFFSPPIFWTKRAILFDKYFNKTSKNTELQTLT